jgi:hypothetical protein
VLLRPRRRAGLRVAIHPNAGSEFKPTGWRRRETNAKAVVGEALG